jgi:drug/metabolite transporter (DMT)-like permease
MKQREQLSQKAEYITGFVISLVGVMVLSFDALLLRVSNVQGFTAAFWRAFYTTLSLTVLFLFTNKKKSLTILRTGKWPMWVSGFLWGGSGLCFALGVMFAGPANTLVLLSLAPLFAAAFSFIFYKRKPSVVTLVATLFAIIGISYMYRHGIGHIPPLGMVFALGTPLFLGSNLTFMRFHKDLSRTAIVMIGGYIGTVVSLVAANFHISLDGGIMWPLVLLGLFVIPFAQVMISTGTRYIPSAESALINSLETVLGILYVWIFLKEAPNLDFIIGASIVFVAITANSVYQAQVRKG